MGRSAIAGSRPHPSAPRSRSASKGWRCGTIGAGSPRAAELRELLAEHKVLVVPEQHLSPDELVAAGRLFGTLTLAHPVMPPIDAEHPEVLEIDATRSRTDPRYRDEWENDTWHTDVSFMPDPPLGSLLSGVVDPLGSRRHRLRRPPGRLRRARARPCAHAARRARGRARRRARSSPCTCGSRPEGGVMVRPTLHRARTRRAPSRAGAPRHRSAWTVRQPDLHDARARRLPRRERRPPAAAVRRGDGT